MYLDFEKLDSKRQQGFFWFQPLPRGTARALVRVAFLSRAFPNFCSYCLRFLHLIRCWRRIGTHCEVGAQCATYTGDLCDGWLHLDQNSGLRRIKVFLKNQLLFYKMALEPMTKYKGRDDLQILWLSMNTNNDVQDCLHRLTVLLGIDGWETRTQQRWSKNGF